jgi:hypothetical protein
MYPHSNDPGELPIYIPPKHKQYSSFIYLEDNILFKIFDYLEGAHLAVEISCRQVYQDVQMWRYTRTGKNKNNVILKPGYNQRLYAKQKEYVMPIIEILNWLQPRPGTFETTNIFTNNITTSTSLLILQRKHQERSNTFYNTHK